MEQELQQLIQRSTFARFWKSARYDAIATGAPFNVALASGFNVT